jgi:hypothetical protein
MFRVLLALGLAMILTDAARAQAPRSVSGRDYYYGPYSVYGAGLTWTPLLTARTTSLATSVRVPDGGTARVGGYATSSQGRNEFGLGGLGRPVRNVGVGGTSSGTSILVRPRIISLYEEEQRLLDGTRR